MNFFLLVRQQTDSRIRRLRNQEFCRFRIRIVHWDGESCRGGCHVRENCVRLVRHHGDSGGLRPLNRRKQGPFDSLKADQERWRRTHQKLKPIRIKARPTKIAISYHWNGQ